MSELSNIEAHGNSPIVFENDGDEKLEGSSNKTRVALVYGTIPSAEEIEQYMGFTESCEFTLVAPESIAGYVLDTCFFKGLNIHKLADHDENPTFLPGLEKALAGFDVVIVKERVCLYAYQAVKSKWINNFKLYVIVDNVTPFPGEDIAQMKTIRDEVTNSADGILVQSKIVKNMLITVEGVDPERVFYVSPHVTPRRKTSEKDRNEALKALELHEGDYVVAAFGQIEWEEGLLDIVHALKHVHDKEGEYCKVKLVICGVGSFDNDLLMRAENLGINHAIRLVDPSRYATLTALNAANLIFASAVQSRDRLEGDPFRVLLATANGIPLLSGRTPLIEEIIGKHRIDFCVGSPRSIAEAIIRSKEAKSLVNNIKSKNLQTMNLDFNEELTLEDFQRVLDHSKVARESETLINIYRQVNEVENLVNKKQYLDAIAMVERLLGEMDLPVHHKANLYRLIGDSFAKLQDNESAKESYAFSIELDPYFSKSHLGLGAVKLSESNYNGSILDFQKAISYAPQDDMAHLGLGLSFQGLGENDEARSWMISALKNNPVNEMGVYSLIRLSNMTDNFSGCIDVLERYLRVKPQNPDMAFTLAGILYKTGNLERTKLVCESILSSAPMHEKARELYDLVLSDLKNSKPKNKKVG